MICTWLKKICASGSKRYASGYKRCAPLYKCRFRLDQLESRASETPPIHYIHFYFACAQVGACQPWLVVGKCSNPIFCGWILIGMHSFLMWMLQNPPIHCLSHYHHHHYSWSLAMHQYLSSQPIWHVESWLQHNILVLCNLQLFHQQKTTPHHHICQTLGNLTFTFHDSPFHN